MKKVRLKAVSEANWEAVCDLELSDEQEMFVASNAYSIAESKFNRYAQPRAVYAGKRVVGFIMWESLHDDDAPHDYDIYRLMIDEDHQGHGYGRAALELAIAEIQTDKRWRKISICYAPSNTLGARLYQSLGFREVGVDEDGEMVAALWNSAARGGKSSS